MEGAVCSVGREHHVIARAPRVRTFLDPPRGRPDHRPSRAAPARADALGGYGQSMAEVWRGQARLRHVLVMALGLSQAGWPWQTLGVLFIRHSLETLRATEDVFRSAWYEVVATGYEPMFQPPGQLYFEENPMVANSQEEVRALVALLAGRQVEGSTYVTGYAAAFDPRLVERWTEGRPWRFRLEEDRTPLVVQFGGLRPVRLVTYRGEARH